MRAHLDGLSPELIYKNKKLCGHHFENSQFVNTKTKDKLVWDAIPTLFDVPNAPPTLASKRKEPKARNLETEKASKSGIEIDLPQVGGEFLRNFMLINGQI